MGTGGSGKVDDRRHWISRMVVVVPRDGDCDGDGGFNGGNGDGDDDNVDSVGEVPWDEFYSFL